MCMFYSQKQLVYLNHTLLGLPELSTIVQLRVPTSLRDSLIEESQALDKQCLQFCQKDFPACL